MCLIQLSYNELHQTYTVIANRDEFLDREAVPAHLWQSGIFAGKDLSAGGTWLGITAQGRFAAVTNVRHPDSRVVGIHSRGDIVTQFLQSDVTSKQIVTQLQQQREQYGGFNVLLYDGKEFYHYNNIFDKTTRLTSGIYSLSNHSLNTPWPKACRSRERFEQLLATDASPQQFITIMQDDTQAQPHELPNTGIDRHMEQQLSSIFIQLDGYGTRCTTFIDKHPHHITFIEQTYEGGFATTIVHEQFKITQNEEK